MNKRKVNIVAIALLTIVISISGCITAFAGETTSTAGGNLTDTITWSISGDVLTITGTGAMPDYYGFPWGDFHFGRVDIKDGITSIGAEAFMGCSSLRSINIPKSVTSIGGSAFYGCSSLESITIPDTVTSIGGRAFSDCSSLESITIPDTVTSIGGGAFSYCSSLRSINIPKSVTSIGLSTFYNCSSLESITIPDTVTSIGQEAFYNCKSLTSIKIPESVKEIELGAFEDCSSLTSINIPDSVTSIEDWTFNDCSSLTSVTIPEIVTSIGEYAFSGCKSLESITIPKTVTSIGKSAFSGCLSLTSLTIPESVTSIGENAFAYSSGYLFGLKKVEILGESRIGPSIFGERYGYENKISVFINPKAKMSIKAAIDNPNIDIYTSASSFPENWGTYSDNLRVKIIYNTSLETFRRLMENEAHAVKVAKASVKLKAYKGGKLKVTASAKNATGYRVYYKKSSWKKYKTYTKGNIKTLNKTFKNLAKGKYTVKVKAFHKADDGKTTWGADSSIKNITVR